MKLRGRRFRQIIRGGDALHIFQQGASAPNSLLRFMLG